MNWFTQMFSETSIIWLLIFTVVSLISGFVSSWLTYRFVKRQEFVDIKHIENKQQKQERIRHEIIRWSNPILSSVQELRSQLRNVLEQSGYVALKMGYDQKSNQNWSISYEYFMNSLLFLFGQYFAWTRMLQDELNFELFESQNEKDLFFQAIQNVVRSLASFPPHYGCQGKDLQVFALQQRAMGELLIRQNSGNKQCMSYSEFLKSMKSKEFQLHFEPLIALLNNIQPSDNCRWKRLEATNAALKDLERVCKDLLNVQNQSA
jgi:hypothetical protein